MLFAGKSAPGGITSIAFENDTVLWLGTSNQGLFSVAVQGKDFLNCIGQYDITIILLWLAKQLTG